VTTTNGIAVMFPDSSVHVVATTTEHGARDTATIEQCFDHLAHEHDPAQHDRFADAHLQACTFDPATVEAEVWPDVKSYLATYGITVDTDNDTEETP
jgi:hypothetical protein